MSASSPTTPPDKASSSSPIPTTVPGVTVIDETVPGATVVGEEVPGVTGGGGGGVSADGGIPAGDDVPAIDMSVGVVSDDGIATGVAPVGPETINAVPDDVSVAAVEAVDVAEAVADSSADETMVVALEQHMRPAWLFTLKKNVWKQENHSGLARDAAK